METTAAPLFNSTAPPAISLPDSYTENGGRAIASTDYQVDLFKNMQRSFKLTPSCVGSITKFLEDDAEGLLALIFHSRNFRGGKGKGERAAAQLAFFCVRLLNFTLYAANLRKFVDCGRWKDLLDLWKLAERCKGCGITLIKPDLEIEVMAEHMLQHFNQEKDACPGLVFKYAPSPNCSLDRDYGVVAKITKLLWPNEDNHKKRIVWYQKMLSSCRKEAGVFESLINRKNFELTPDKIAKLPAGCFHKNKSSFRRNNGGAFESYLKSAKKLDNLPKTSGLQPHDLVRDYLNQKDETENEATELQWQSLINAFKNRVTGNQKERVLVVCDTSGSMFQGHSNSPIYVAISLTLFVLELQKERSFITFDTHPQWHRVRGESLLSRVKSCASAQWGGSTNIDKTWGLIYKECQYSSTPPTRLLILSDMQMDAADHQHASIHYKWKKTFREAGLMMPQVVYWFINSSSPSQVASWEYGAAEISGYDGNMAMNVLCGEIEGPKEYFQQEIAPFRRLAQMRILQTDDKMAPENLDTALATICLPHFLHEKRPDMRSRDKRSSRLQLTFKEEKKIQANIST